MEEQIVLEGIGTNEEMEVHLITELKRRDLLVPPIVASVVFEDSPSLEEPGPYRIRIPTP